jgi:hypothetical protein
MIFTLRKYKGFSKLTMEKSVQRFFNFFSQKYFSILFFKVIYNKHFQVQSKKHSEKFVFRRQFSFYSR